MATVTSLSFRMNSFYNGEGMRQARRDIDRLDSSMNAMSKSSSALVPGFKAMVSTVLTLGPALVPIAGGLIGIGAVAGSAMAAGGAAVGIFAIAMKGAIESTVGANSAFGASAQAIKVAEKALAKTTVGTKEYDKALKKVTMAEQAHKDAINAMPPVQKKFATAYDGMTASISKFNDDNAKFTLGPATTAMEAFSAALPKVTPLLKAMSPVIQQIADNTKAWVQDGGLDRFIRFLIDYGVPAFRDFVQAGVNMLTGMGNGMRTFGPMGLEFTQWLVDTSRKFAMWANGGGFGKFLAWLQDNKGSLLGVVKDLGTFLGNMGQAAAGLSGASFTVLGTLLKVLASFPPGVLQAIVYAWLAWNAALTVYNVVAFIAAAATTAMTLAATPFGLLFMGMALTIGLVVLAIVALAVGIFFLVKYWDTVWSALKTAALAVWKALQVAWEATWNAIKSAALTVWNFLTHGWGQFALALLGPLGVIIAIAVHWDQIWGGIKSVALTVWGALKTAWAATTGWISEKFFAVVAPIRDMWNKVWPEMQLAAQNVWNNLKSAWAALWSFFRAAWELFWSVFGGQFKAGWSAITVIATTSWDIMKAAWSIFWTTISSAASVAWAIIQGTFRVGIAVVTGIWNIFTAVLSGAWNILWATVTSIWNVFYAMFSAAFRGAWNVIKTIATGVWEIIKAAWDALWKTITAIFLVFTAIFTGHWGKAWNAIKDAGQSIWNLIKTIFQTFLNTMMAIFTAWVGVFKAGWQAFLTAIQTVWNAIWTAIKNLLQTITAAMLGLANAFWTSIKAVFNAGLAAVQAVWTSVWNAIRTHVKTVWDAVVGFATAFWTSIRTAFSAGSNWILTTFWNPVNNFFTKTLPSAFDAAVTAIGKGWDRLRSTVRAPVQAIVNVVYNNGIVKLWNAVAGVFGAPKLDPFVLPAFKEGGPTGKGSDRGFLAKLHPDEHVWTKQEVAGAGGHEAVARLRQQAMNGQKVRVQGNRFGNRSFDDGGGLFGTGFGPDVGPDLIPDGIIGNVIGKLKDLALGAISGPFGAAVDAVAKAGKVAVRASIPGSNSGMEKLGTGMIDKMAKIAKDWVKQNDVDPGMMGGGDAAAGLAWARTQAGKPYQWGGNGNPSWDCSGFMSAIESVIRGEKPHRRWATGSFSGGQAPPGWKLNGKSPFEIGITNAGVGHTAGTLNKVDVECRGGQGCIVGGSARGAGDGMFTARYGFMPAVGGSVGGATKGAAQATAKAMLKNYGWGADQWGGLQALWQRESGWNYKAKNASSGAYGIPQALPASKMKSAGADYLTNATTQIKWGLGYIKGRYGTPSKADAFQRANNWYGRGTRSAAPGWGVVGDRGLELMRTRGGEQIKTLDSLVGGGGGDRPIVINIDARGATVAAVKRLENELPDKLRIALEQGVGSRP